MGIRLDQSNDSETSSVSTRIHTFIQQFLGLGVSLFQADSAEMVFHPDSPLGLETVSTHHSNEEKVGWKSYSEIILLDDALMIPVWGNQKEPMAYSRFIKRRGQWPDLIHEWASHWQSVANASMNCMMMKNDLEQLGSMLIKQSRLATLGQMNAEIIHEINNPLAVLQAGLSLLKIRVDKPEFTLEYLKEVLDKLLRNTERISSIIYHVRKFSRSTEQEDVESSILNDLIESSIYYCEQRFRSLNVKFEKPIVPLDWKVNCRSVQVSQVLINLLNNAVDAAVNTDDPWVKMIVNQEGGWTMIQVMDSGRGISEKLLNRLFEPFFTTKSKNGGTGLGLSISRNLLEANGGLLEYAEIDGHTTFVVKLSSSVQQA